MVKASDIRELPRDDVERQLAETKEELFNLRFQNATGQLENSRRLRQLRKDIARYETVLREIDLAESKRSEQE